MRAAGALLIVDETHVQFAVHGGGTTAFGLQPDMLTGGKGIGGGVPIGVVGMTNAIADVVSANRDHDPGLVETGDAHGLAIGGTLYANALSMAAARIGLAEIFTAEAGARVDTLGQRLQAGLQREVDRVGLPWTIDRLGGRIQFRLTPEPPRTGADSFASLVLPLGRCPQGLPAQPRHLGLNRHGRPLGLLRHRRGRRRHLHRCRRRLPRRAHPVGTPPATRPQQRVRGPASGRALSLVG